MPAATGEASGVAIADRLPKQQPKIPATFAETVAAVEPYLVVDGAGNLRLDVPVQVISDLDVQSLAALQHSVQAFNDLTRTA
ncbi:hypothetical protein [Salinispora arenicola]|uniref:hypothetical protein n=1 Tax=Salinispora arenicola TaxID=168697 RepID=UPI0027DCF8F4|nr:hypothetical protein [Salinispora arenicola]